MSKNVFSMLNKNGVAEDAYPLLRRESANVNSFMIASLLVFNFAITFFFHSKTNQVKKDIWYGMIN